MASAGLGMRCRRRWGLTALLLFALSFAQLPVLARSPGQQLLTFALDGRINLYTAAVEMGVDTSAVAADLGYGEVNMGIFEASRDAQLLLADCWMATTILSGSAADELGLADDRVLDLFGLRMANDASFLPECDSGAQSALVFFVSVWTVGTEYPVAYLIEVEGRLLPDVRGGDSIPFAHRELGHSDSSQIEEYLRIALRDAVENFALRFLRIARHR